jgi:DNA (cytosine-5)-methyltransferase 1
MSSRCEFTYLSTFAGCGGSSLGYKWAGGRGVAAVEFDDNAVETYRLNFPDTPVLHRDICTVTAQELLDLTGLQVGDLDILDGSPPCQGFSTAGKRVLTDPRNSLFREYVRLIEGLQPRVFVMENVSGMVKGKMRLVFREIMLALKATGYTVRCKLLNAMYYEVPQSRERLIWIGVRPDVGREPEFPGPVGAPKTVGEVLANVPPAHGICRWPTPGTKLAYACQRMLPGQSADDVLGGNLGFNMVRLDNGKPCPTLGKSGGLSGPVHPTEARKLSTGEAQAMASFPIDFVFRGTWYDCIDRIGNSVPPRFMYHIAAHIRDHILSPASAQDVT